MTRSEGAKATQSAEKWPIPLKSLQTIGSSVLGLTIRCLPSGTTSRVARAMRLVEVDKVGARENDGNRHTGRSDRATTYNGKITTTCFSAHS